MRAIRSVLLDLDGTLIDSRPGILASGRAALRALGHEPLPTFESTLVIGPPIEDIMRAVLRAYGDDRVDQAVAAYRKDYGVNGLAGNELYPGIRNALGEMRKAGVQLYLATSKRTIFARPILEHLDLAAWFDGIYGSEPDGARDHKPELIAHVLAQHRLAPETSVMVGDRRHDIAGAHANGMRAYGALWGYGSRDELEEAGADQLIDSAEGLARAVLSVGAVRM